MKCPMIIIVNNNNSWFFWKCQVLYTIQQHFKRKVIMAYKKVFLYAVHYYDS